MDDDHAIQLDLGFGHNGCSMGTGRQITFNSLRYLLNLKLQLHAMTEKYVTVINNKKIVVVVE
jgi:hypothetical protein